MFWQHLEADEVGVFVADHGAVNEDVILFVHQLLERVHVQGPPHAHKQLRVFQVRVEFVKRLWLRAVRKVQIVKLIPVFK
jgi:hypothetical protein